MTEEGQGPRAEGRATKGRGPRPGAEVRGSQRRIGSFEDLVVWQRAMQLVRSIYELSRRFPADERFGLTSQIRRAAVSIPSNIAEGHERHTTREYVLFVSHAEGSLAEVRTQLFIAVDLGYCAPEAGTTAFDQMDEIKRMLNALRRTLDAK